MTRMQKVLISCSGATHDILAQPECRADATKYAMIGMIVLLTAVFAFFSSTFALYTGIGSLPLAITLGTAWALMIFTLDRFVVSGIRKSDVEGLPVEQQWRKRGMEWLVALPRIALAGLISIVVATPLELRFFEREINAQLQRNQARARLAAGDGLKQEFDEAATLHAKNDELRKSVDALWAKQAEASTTAAKELAGKALTGLRGDGPVYRQLKAQADHLAALAAESEKRNAATIARNDEQIAQIENEWRRRQDEAQKTIDMSGGFLARYGALGEMAAANSDVRVARTFLMLLFLAVELSPVLTKLLLHRGPYDDFIETLEHSVRVEQLTARSNKNDDAHAEVALNARKNSERIDLEDALNARTFDYDKVSSVAGSELEEAQGELARASIDDWRRKQLMRFERSRASRMPIRRAAAAADHNDAPSS